MIYLSLDLELNQREIPKIIEVGYVIGDTQAPIGDVIRKRSFLIDPGEPITPEIVKLTGITDEMIATSVTTTSLECAWVNAVMDAQQLGCGRNAMTWGGDDMSCLRRQLGIAQDKSWFAPTVMDVKKVYQFIRQAQGRGTQSGLARSLGKVGLAFKGTKHRAADDAHMTLAMAQHLTTILKGVDFAFKS